jgi:Spy/CpxP family protein refolding chaperone
MFGFWRWACAHNGPAACGPHFHHHRHGCAPQQGDSGGGPQTHSHSHSQEHDGGGGGPWGVRRPLRFMARRLNLTDEQTSTLAAILDDLKTERAQAQVDHRRAISAFADAFLGSAFDEAQVRNAAQRRADSARRVEEAVTTALQRTFDLLDDRQRKQLAYLLRAGDLTI